MTKEYILALIAAVGTVFSSIAAIKLIIRHEMKICDERLEAFKEGLSYHESRS